MHKQDRFKGGDLALQRYRPNYQFKSQVGRFLFLLIDVRQQC